MSGGAGAEKPLLDVLRLGLTRYEDVHRLQEELALKRAQGEVRDTLILCEHESVITLGRGAKRAALGEAAPGVPVVEVERGGEATYHGPGQVVAYPILLLPEGRRDLHRYLRDLEEVVIRVLAEVEVRGERRSGLTGVWVGGRKICSIGVAVRRWVTFHGFALNLRTDLAAFEGFRPCGLDPAVMTRLADHVDFVPRPLLFEVLIVKHVCEVFGLDLPLPPAESPGPTAGLPIFPGP